MPDDFIVWRRPNQNLQIGDHFCGRCRACNAISRREYACRTYGEYVTDAMKALVLLTSQLGTGDKEIVWSGGLQFGPTKAAHLNGRSQLVFLYSCAKRRRVAHPLFCASPLHQQGYCNTFGNVEDVLIAWCPRLAT